MRCRPLVLVDSGSIAMSLKKMKQLEAVVVNRVDEAKGKVYSNTFLIDV
jgi:hypothetical protein